MTLVDPTSAIPHVSAAPDRTPLLDPKPARSASPFFIPPSRTSTFLAISYASISGLLSGMCLLFAKSGVELLVLTVAGKNQFWRWESWALVTGLVVFALLQVLSPFSSTHARLLKRVCAVVVSSQVTEACGPYTRVPTSVETCHLTIAG